MKTTLEVSNHILTMPDEQVILKIPMIYKIVKLYRSSLDNFTIMYDGHESCQDG